MIHVTANTRFSDADPIRAKRIICAWNAAVRKDDLVILIGTFAIDRPLYYMQQLNGLIISVVGENDADFPGAKFNQLYLYADDSLTHKLDSKKEVIWELSRDPEALKDTGYPVILTHDKWAWKKRGVGQWVVDEVNIYPIGNPVVNANIDLWDSRPISLQMITQKYLCS